MSVTLFPICKTETPSYYLADVLYEYIHKYLQIRHRYQNQNKDPEKGIYLCSVQLLDTKH